MKFAIKKQEEEAVIELTLEHNPLTDSVDVIAKHAHDNTYRQTIMCFKNGMYITTQNIIMKGLLLDSKGRLKHGVGCF